jgi:hypothetical protein
MNTREQIEDWIVSVTDDPEITLADGLDDAFVGLSVGCIQPFVAVYDFDKLIAILIERDGMSDEEAREFFEFNVIGAYVGPRTPIYLHKYDRPSRV